MIMRFEIMRFVSMIVRLETVSRMLVLLPVLARAMFVRMRVPMDVRMDVRMRVLVNVFVRMRQFAVSVLVTMAVHVHMAVAVTMSVVCIHRASLLRPSRSPPSMP
jgi:hypothetical protein